MEETKNVHPNKKNSANIFLRRFECKEQKKRKKNWIWAGGGAGGERPRLPPRPTAACAASPAAAHSAPSRRRPRRPRAPPTPAPPPTRQSRCASSRRLPAGPPLRPHGAEGKGEGGAMARDPDGREGEDRVQWKKERRSAEDKVAWARARGWKKKQPLEVVCYGHPQIQHCGFLSNHTGSSYCFVDEFLWEGTNNK